MKTPEILTLRRANTALQKPIFIVGCPRSGTTVLGACLSAHTCLAGANESLFLLDCWRIANDLHGGNNLQGWAPLAEYISCGQLLEAVGAFSDAIILSLLKKTGKDRYIDHTPWYVACIPFIRSLYPDCIIVHVLRDGRHVVASLQNSFERGFAWAGKTTAERAALWNSLVITGLNSKQSLLIDEYFEVRYEDFCKDPILCLQWLLNALGLHWDERVLAPLAVPHATPASTASILAQTDSEGRLQIRPKNADFRWPKSWTPVDKSDFLRVAEEGMCRSGYLKMIPHHYSD